DWSSDVCSSDLHLAVFAQARAQQRRDVAGAAGQVQHPVAGPDLRGGGEIALPDPVDAQAHQVVHQVIAACDRGEHLADELLLLPHGDVTEAEMGGAGFVGCAHAAIIAPTGMTMPRLAPMLALLTRRPP